MPATATKGRRRAAAAVALIGTGPVAIAVGTCLIVLGACASGAELSGTQAAPTAAELLTGTGIDTSDYLVSTPFELTQNTIRLKAHVGSAATARTFILDSGAPMTISPALASQLALDAAATSIALAGPSGGHDQVPLTRIPRVRIAGLTFTDVGSVVDWVQPPDELACLSRDGLMGASLLQAAIWQIDFQSGVITITDSLPRLPGLTRATGIPFTRADAAGSPRISVGVNDLQDLSLLIDLGFNGSLAIPTAMLEAAGGRIDSAAPEERGRSASTVLGDGQSATRIARVGELRLGDLQLKDFPVITGPAVSDFHVGIEFLRHFRVTIDWLNDHLYLEPRAPAAALYYDFASYGFTPQLTDDGLVVGTIWSGSPALQAGLELGDRLVEIDGRDTTSSDFASFCSLLDSVGLFGSQRAPISVTRLRDGQRETFHLDRTPPGP
jgi:hypothetical protein